MAFGFGQGAATLASRLRAETGDPQGDAFLVASDPLASLGFTQHIAGGPGPRAAQALMLASRARALVGGRLAPSLDDIKALAEPVLKHRMALTFAARAEGETVAGVIQRLVERIG